MGAWVVVAVVVVGVVGVPGALDATEQSFLRPTLEKQSNISAEWSWRFPGER